MTERRHPLSRRPVPEPEPVKSDGALIAAFFAELDGRINGTVGSNTPQSRSELASYRPNLVKRANHDPAAFVGELERLRKQMRAGDE